jgi:hypothetical protein
MNNILGFIDIRRLPHGASAAAGLCPVQFLIKGELHQKHAHKTSISHSGKNQAA